MHLAGNAVRSDAPDGYAARWWSPAPAVLCTEASGVCGMPVVDLFVDGFRAVLQAAPTLQVRGFHDWERVLAYESRARERFTDEVTPLMAGVECVDILIASRLLAMGISVANIVLSGKLHATSDRAAFEARRAAELAKPRLRR